MNRNEIKREIQLRSVKSSRFKLFGSVVVEFLRLILSVDTLRLTLFLESTSTVSLSTLRTVSASFFITASYNRRSFLSTGEQKYFLLIIIRPVKNIGKKCLFRKQAPLLVDRIEYSTYTFLSNNFIFPFSMDGWIPYLYFLSEILLKIISLLIETKDRSSLKFVHLIKTRKKVVNLICNSAYSQVWIGWKVKGKTDVPRIISFSYLFVLTPSSLLIQRIPLDRLVDIQGRGCLRPFLFVHHFSLLLPLLHLGSRHVRLSNLKIEIKHDAPSFHSPLISLPNADPE